MPIVKLTVKKNFRHEGRDVAPGDVIELTADEARVMVSRGKASVAEEPKEQPQAKARKGRYARRDMVAEEIPPASITLTTTDIPPESQT